MSQDELDELRTNLRSYPTIWVSRCPHCDVIWAVESKTNPVFTDHKMPRDRNPVAASWAEIESWDRRWEVASDLIEEYLANGLDASAAIDELGRINTERRAKQTVCPGVGLRAVNPIMDNSDPETYPPVLYDAVARV
jgi:hypothetical protein